MDLFDCDALATYPDLLWDAVEYAAAVLGLAGLLLAGLASGARGK